MSLWCGNLFATCQLVLCSLVALKWIHGQTQGLTNYVVQDFNVLKLVVSQAAKKFLSLMYLLNLLMLSLC